MTQAPENLSASPLQSHPGVPLTAEQLLELPDQGRRYELVRGELRMMSPGGNLHGKVAMRVGSLLDQHVRRHRLGVVYAAETGFLLSRNPDTVLAPDAAFVSRKRLAPHEQSTGYLPLAPDLVVEVISPQDRFSQVEEKARRWLAAGTSLVLLVDPGQQRVHLLRDPRQVIVLAGDEPLDASDVVPGWQVPVRELFA